MADKDNGLFILIVLLSCLSFVFSLFSFAPTSYNDLTDLPELFEVGDIPNLDLQHGLCLWLPFDGVALDKSGFRGDGSVVGATYVDGYFDRCLSFNGSSDYVSVAYQPLHDLSELFISAWVYPVGGGTAQYDVLCKNPILEVPYRFSILRDSGLLAFQIYNDGWFNALSNVSVNMDSWSMVSVGYVQPYVNFYINGSLVSQVDFDYALPVNVGGLTVGYYSSTNHYFKGLIDDVRLYNRVLNNYEIEKLYNLGV